MKYVLILCFKFKTDETILMCFWVLLALSPWHYWIGVMGTATAKKSL